MVKEAQVYWPMDMVSCSEGGSDSCCCLRICDPTELSSHTIMDIDYGFNDCRSLAYGEYGHGYGDKLS